MSTSRPTLPSHSNPGSSSPTSSAPAAARSGRLSSGSAVMLVAEREITTQVRTKSFLISNAITLAVIVIGIVLSGLLGGGDSEATRVAVLPETTAVVTDTDGLEAVPAADLSAAEELVRSGEVTAAVVPDSSTLGYRVIGLEKSPDDVVGLLAVQPEVELLAPAEVTDGLRYLIGLGFGLVFMAAAMGSGAMIVQNTVQEKQSRVVEILLAAVPARTLMAGKILGNSVIGIGSAVAMAAAAALGLALSGQGELLDLLTAPMLWFVLFFVFGFVLVAGVFAAGAALVSRQEDTGSVMMPAMSLLMVPYFGMVFFADNQVVMTVLSYIPFSAPVAMPVRLFFGEAMWWEPLVALVILVGCTVAVMAVAARIYTGSLLRMGARVKVRDALRAQQ